jgi:hypothetical protein
VGLAQTRSLTRPMWRWPVAGVGVGATLVREPRGCRSPDSVSTREPLCLSILQMTGDATKVGYGSIGKVCFVLIPAVLGAGLGLVLHFLLGWLLGLPWLPFQGPLRLIDSIPDEIALPALMGLGVVAGGIFGGYALADELSVTVTSDNVRLERGSLDRTLRRSAVASVFLDNKHLVLLGPDTNELAREKIDQPESKLSAAFTEQGYPWRPDGDPREDDFRLWSAGAVGLPPGAEALLAIRAKALSDSKRTADAADLRAELIKLDVVVRDQGGRQYWRRAGGPDQLR